MKLTLGCVLLSLIFILFLAVYGWGFSTRSGAMVNISKSGLERVNDEWSKFKKKELVAGLQVMWPIKITQVSSFGGFYVKGHIYKNKSSQVHLIWAPDDKDLNIVRQKIKKGDIAIIKGILEGISEAGEVILSVKNVEIPATTN